MRDRVLEQPVLDGLFLATILTVTFHKLQWELAGSLTLSDVLTSVFLVLFAWDRFERADARFTRTALVGLAFFVAFAVVYLLGFYNLDTGQALAQWAKGMVKFVLHFGFVVAGVALLARRGVRFYWYALAAFCGGIALNAALRRRPARPRRGGGDEPRRAPDRADHVAADRHQRVRRRRWHAGGLPAERADGRPQPPRDRARRPAARADAAVPAARAWAPHDRTPLGVLLAFLLVVELATLSRSGLLGLALRCARAGDPVQATPATARVPDPARRGGAGRGAVVVARLDFFLTVLRARTNTSRAAASPHFEVYSFVPDVLSSNPLLGLGLNNFAVYYEFVTGRPDFGPHSFYVATIVETGIVGAVLFAAFVVWLFRRLAAARRIGRALTAARDPLAARVRPLAWGMTAALVATLVANVFYLTMTFYYFYVFATLAAALPVAFGLARRE